MRSMFKWILLVLAIPLLYVVGNILFAILTKYKPAAIEPVSCSKPLINKKKITDSTFSFLTWNIGYGGLGAETDFFYDGGKMVIADKSLVEKYTKGINHFLKENESTDFILLQEVDKDSKRSWHIDQQTIFEKTLGNHLHFFAKNYDVKFVPKEYLEPLGKILGGLVSAVKFMPISSERVALSGITDFPRNLFYLERCLLVQRFALANGKDLVVINTHFEAYDDGGVKRKQMAEAKEILVKEYAKGNYVVLGGDWNIAPPDFDVKKWEKEPNKDPLYFLKNDPNYIPGWKYVYDGNTPTNRKNNHAFDEKTTFTTVIDYFFVSPNVEVLEVKGVDFKFQFSDHNPVKMKIKLIEPAS